MAARRTHLRYFADENAFGLAKILLRERNDIAYGVRSVRIGGKRDMRPAELAELFTRLESRLTRLAIKLGLGPCAVSMQPSGIREIRLRELGMP